MKQVAAPAAGLVWAVVSALIALSSEAAAVSEGEWATGAGASFQFGSEGAFWDGQAEYGLSETFHAGLELGAGHALEGFGLDVLRVAPLFGARFDVVQWVPYAAIGPTLRVGVGSAAGVTFGGDGVTGLDYRWARNWAVGAHYHFTALADADPSLLHRVGLRVMYHWGW